MRLAAYSAFTAIAFQSRLAYRNQVWASAFGDLVGVFARIAIWMAAFAGASSVGGVTLPEMVTYSILAWQLLYWDFSRLLHEVGAAIRTGDVAVYLLKPLHYPGYLLSSHLGHFAFDFVTTVLPLLLIVGFTVGLVPPASLFHGAMFLVFWLVSWLMLFCLASACGIIAFWLMTAFSLEWFLMAIMSLVSGAVIPLWYMPPPLAAAIAYLPFAWVSYYPAAVYLGKLDVTQTWLHLGIGLLWLAALGTLVLLLWSKARHRLIVQGG
jgi:ABC-2 type transport system permease protein